MRSVDLAIVVLVALSAPACAAVTAPESRAVGAETRTVAVNDSQKVVCERRHVVGSNIESKVCKTKAEWEAGRIAAQQMQADHMTQGKPIGR